MGIKNLMSLLKSKAAKSITNCDLSKYSGKTIARDASIGIYAFLIATNFGKNSKTLQDSEGNPTAHLIGILNNTLLYRAYKITPIWVFDGKPPEIKSFTLEKRKESRDANTILLEQTEDKEMINKYAARSITLTPQVIKDAKKVIELLGIAYVEAKSEAEAECTNLTKKGIADAVFSEDMDSLAFGAGSLVRGNTELTVVKLEMVLSLLGLNFAEFVDLCLLLGCDYTSTIKGIGQVNALRLIKKHKNIEEIIESIENDPVLKEKYIIPQDFNYLAAREYFMNPDVNGKHIAKSPPNLDELKEFLIREKAFSVKRVENFIKKFEANL